MRLIDADELIVREKYLAEKYKGDFGEIVASYVIEILDSAFTIDAMPVRHGKWILYYDIEQGRALRCSECKMVFWVGDGREGNFCPNCGARMDEE